MFGGEKPKHISIKAKLITFMREGYSCLRLTSADDTTYAVILKQHVCTTQSMFINHDLEENRIN